MSISFASFLSKSAFLVAYFAVLIWLAVTLLFRLTSLRQQLQKKAPWKTEKCSDDNSFTLCDDDTFLGPEELSPLRFRIPFGGVLLRTFHCLAISDKFSGYS